jgi:uncharacterized membrane protein YukC
VGLPAWQHRLEAEYADPNGIRLIRLKNWCVRRFVGTGNDFILVKLFNYVMYDLSQGSDRQKATFFICMDWRPDDFFVG